MSKTTLKPGDLVIWDPEREGVDQSVMLVSNDGTELLFQFGTVPFSQMEILYEDGRKDYGLTAEQAVAALEYGVFPLAFPGVLFKAFDNATGTAYGDPRLETE